MMRSTAVVFALTLAAGCHKQTEPSPEPPPAPAAAAAEAEVEIRAVPVRGAVSVLYGQGGNIGVQVGDDGTLMIDDQFEPLAPKIRAAVEALHPGPIRFLINTHWHGDHTGGNPVFGADATIVAHANVRARLMTTQNVRGRVIEPLPKAGLPVITFDQSVTLHLNGEDVRVIHLPTGHTDGDSVIWFTGSNVVHMGDHFFRGKFPFVDLDTGGNPRQYAANIATVLEMIPADAAIIPGHGEVGAVQELREFHGMLTSTIDYVAGQKAAGKTLAQIQRAGLPAPFASYDGGFIDAKAWIATLYAADAG